MDETQRPLRPCRRRRVWRPLSRIGLPLRSGCPHRVSRVRRPQDDTDRSGLHQIRMGLPRPQFGGASLLDISQDSPVVGGSELSRFKLLSVDDLTPTAELNDRHDGDENGEESIGKRTYVIHKYQSTDDDSNEDKDHPFGDPFVKDGFGNLTDWRLSDLNAEFSKLLEKESSKLKTKENKLSKEEKLKMHNDCMKHYMKYSLQKYNNEQHLSGAMCFEFVETVKESSVVEEDFKFYHHFNFMAKQTCSTAFLFFAEVIPDGDYCEVTNCKLLVDDDDERCFGCKNQGNADLRHPGGDNVYVGGHEDCVCPFFIDSDSEEDDSD